MKTEVCCFLLFSHNETWCHLAEIYIYVYGLHCSPGKGDCRIDEYYLWNSYSSHIEESDHSFQGYSEMFPHNCKLDVSNKNLNAFFTSYHPSKVYFLKKIKRYGYYYLSFLFHECLLLINFACFFSWQRLSWTLYAFIFVFCN